ncbi:MAG: ATPase [Prolixibacteraceae bacterium]
MEEKGREVVGQSFKISKSDHDLLYKLLVYTIGDRENSERLGLCLQKGIMLTGPVGCGKTSIMKLLRYFQAQQERYILKSCREISYEFISKGFDVISKYSTHNLDHPKTWCFDDLGTEQNLKYYGNECNVMAEILLNRYELFIATGTVTHLTTNLSASEIETYYGNRVRSRMRQMFNLIFFSKDANDKRK